VEEFSAETRDINVEKLFRTRQRWRLGMGDAYVSDFDELFKEDGASLYI
jgi:hypothetical protein